MHLKSCCSLVFCSLVILHGSASLKLAKDHSSEQKPKKPVFPDKFQVEVEGLFKESSTEVNGIVYFDKKNNRGTLDSIWQGDNRRIIFNFDTNELITIQDLDCTVGEIPDNQMGSSFPFTMDKTSKKKTIAPAERAFYFENSTYYGEDIVNDIPFYMYTGEINLPQYELKNCHVTHTFTETDFKTATCEGRSCKPILSSIAVHCPDAEGTTEIVSHLYRFFRFDESAPDDSVFHALPGIFCPRMMNKPMPYLPFYFSFSYDIVSRESQYSSLGSVKSLHKKLWYDGNIQLVRVDDYNGKNNLQFTKVYDFLNEVSYIFPSKLDDELQAGIGNLTKDFTLNKATLLPEEIFPFKFRENNNTPAYVGKRTAHGLDYEVWSNMAKTPKDDLRIVTDMYFLEIPEDVTGSINQSTSYLSHMEFYAYNTNEETLKRELTETRFIPLNDFKSAFRDWSAFDVSPCFSESQKKNFEMKIEGPLLQVGSVTYEDVIGTLYLEVITHAEISVIRLSGLKMTESNNNVSVFSGWMLENPNKLGFGKNNSEPDLEAAYKHLKNSIDLGLLSFNASNELGEVFLYTVTCLDTLPRYGEKEKEGKPKGYSGGAMAGIAIVMLIVGLVLGVVAFVAFLRSKKGAEVQKLVNSS